MVSLKLLLKKTWDLKQERRSVKIKKFSIAITDVLSSSIKDRLEELEHQDVYELIVSDLADRLEQDFDNFDVDKFINAT